MKLIFKLQQWIVGHLKTYIADSEACGLALALLIGYKNNLDRDLIAAYSNTGVVHVIAISGLHLGIIYIILSWLCVPLKDKSWGKLVSPLIVIGGLWIFSILAGASPSILRSAVMFSCIAAGKLFNKQTSLINNLSASAFILLCYDPFWLYDLGFLLSYGALLSIAIYSKPLYNLFYCKNRVIDEVWKLTSVTIAAQILTAPLIIYNFHKFPTFFIVTNLFAVPASTIILVGEILLCASFASSAISALLGTLLTLFINIMNEVIRFIDKLPGSSFNGMELSFFQAALMYLFIASISNWLMLQHRKSVHAALLIAVAFFVADLLKYGDKLQLD